METLIQEVTERCIKVKTNVIPRIVSHPGALGLCT